MKERGREGVRRVGGGKEERREGEREGVRGKREGEERWEVGRVQCMVNQYPVTDGFMSEVNLKNVINVRSCYYKR